MKASVKKVTVPRRETEPAPEQRTAPRRGDSEGARALTGTQIWPPSLNTQPNVESECFEDSPPVGRVHCEVCKCGLPRAARIVNSDQDSQRNTPRLGVVTSEGAHAL